MGTHQFQRYNTEGFFCVKISLLSIQEPKADEEAKHTKSSLTTLSARRVFGGNVTSAFGSSLEAKISPVFGWALLLVFVSGPTHTWRKHFLSSGALKEYLCECQAFD
ncbi:hypothetical protein ILYODFUR_001142 [Ilyodon furcidens]|uniref:Uncharacterized protein n=1 Tax=Ilyodon furcidens TaxID=33524 RepID=A0ABV0VB09_9TELE